MSRRKLTDEERIAAVQDVLNGNGGCKQIAPKYGINHETLRAYVRIALTEGMGSSKASAVLLTAMTTLVWRAFLPH